MSQSKIAPVEWAQRKDLVYIHFVVHDCETPQVKVEKDKLVFSVNSKDGVKYENTLNLYSEINVDESKWHNHARGAEFVLIKTNPDAPYWPRLLKESAKNHWLKVDFNKWVDEDESADEGGAPDAGDMMGGGMGGGGGANFEEMMRQMGGLGGLGGGAGGGAPFNMLDDLDTGDDAEGEDEEGMPALE